MGYKYRPVRYYGIVFAITWAFWISAAVVGHGVPDNPTISFTLMLFGLLVPPITVLCTIMLSKSAALNKDLFFGTKHIGRLLETR